MIWYGCRRKKKRRFFSLLASLLPWRLDSWSSGLRVARTCALMNSFMMMRPKSCSLPFQIALYQAPMLGLDSIPIMEGSVFSFSFFLLLSHSNSQYPSQGSQEYDKISTTKGAQKKGQVLSLPHGILQRNTDWLRELLGGAILGLLCWGYFELC